MEIGPVPGIRAVMLPGASGRASAEALVIKVDPPARPDDAGSGTTERSSRGLEEETENEEQPVDGEGNAEDSLGSESSGSSIDLLA